jgi:hypothetical protein
MADVKNKKKQKENGFGGDEFSYRNSFYRMRGVMTDDLK